MRSLRTALLAFAGLVLPVGLALAVYLSSAGTIAAEPVSLPLSSETIAQPSTPAKAPADKRPARKPKTQSTSGTTTGDDGGGTTTDDRSGGGGGGDDNSGAGSSDSGSGSNNSGPGSGSSGSSGSGSGDDD
jgi:hypothetical protein